MNENLGYKVIFNFLFRNNVDTCILYFDCKEWSYDCMVNTAVNISKIDKSEHLIYCGIWNRYSKEKDVISYISHIKYEHSLYEVSELNNRARSFIVNGAGPKHFGYFVPDLWWTDIADLHDLMYFVGGNYKDRKWADKVFLWGMLRTSSWLKKTFGFVMAYVYYYSVRLFGKKAFEQRAKKFSMYDINSKF